MKTSLIIARFCKKNRKHDKIFNKNLFDSIHRQIVSSFCRRVSWSLQNCSRRVYKSKVFAKNRRNKCRQLFVQVEVEKVFSMWLWGSQRAFQGTMTDEIGCDRKKFRQGLFETKVWHLFNLGMSEICWRHLGTTPKVTPKSITLRPNILQAFKMVSWQKAVKTIPFRLVQVNPSLLQCVRGRTDE